MDMATALTEAARKERAARTPGLTERQDDLLRFLTNREVSGEGTPSYEEIMWALGLSSKNRISNLLAALEERGFITRIPNRARAIKVNALADLAHLPDAVLATELRSRGWRVAQ